MSTPKMPTAVLPYNALIGQVIQKRRDLRKKSQGEIALALGLTQSAYSRIESGQTALTVSHLRSLAHALGDSPESILSEADNLAKQLARKGVQVPNEKPTDDNDAAKAALLIGLGILVALLASK
ncbi:MAG: helix-turn-helix domain-containing protein [Candidatus Pacebacteria bacterium]|jgi:transcriptional regulator with XRE-family HTH domain|nr:helix-turn-helix domain-containing protein [Candidatus Paceibacterota bacterium]